MSETDYALHFYDTSGVKQAVVTDFAELAYTRRVNAPGAVRFSLAGDHSLLSSLEDKWEVEVWRKPKSTGEWRREITATFRDEEWTHDSESGSVFIGTCFSVLHKLTKRIANYPAGSNLRTEFVNVDVVSIMRTLVITNFTSSATTANGRKRDGVDPTIAVAANASTVESVTFFCFGKDILTALQELSQIAACDFDLVKTGTNQYTFRVYPGQLGTDRTASVLFALDRGNMENPNYRQIRSSEKTVAAVWGQGEREVRQYETVTGNGYVEGTNDSEVYVDARDISGVDTDTADALQYRGRDRLQQLKASPEFTFGILQTPSSEYVVHYDLGDLVSAQNPFSGVTSELKILSISVALERDGKETLNVEVGKTVS